MSKSGEGFHFRAWKNSSTMCTVIFNIIIILNAIHSLMNLKHNPGTWMHHIYIISLSVNYLNLSEQKYKSDMKNYYIICLYIIFKLYFILVCFWLNEYYLPFKWGYRINELGFEVMVPISSSITLFLIITPQLLIFSVVCADIEVVIMWYICMCLKIKNQRLMLEVKVMENIWWMLFWNWKQVNK